MYNGKASQAKTSVAWAERAWQWSKCVDILCGVLI